MEKKKIESKIESKWFLSFLVTKKKLVCATIEVMIEGENSSIKNFSYNKEGASLSLSLFFFIFLLFSHAR